MKRGIILLFTLLLVISACSNKDITPSRIYGNTYFLIDDAKPIINDFSTFEITVSDISVHRSDEDRWVVVTTEPKTFNLLSFADNDLLGLLSEKRVEIGNYNQIRFTISKVKAEYLGQNIDVKIPSNSIKINSDLEVISGGGNTIILDFLLNESLHKTGDGKIIFAPVINLKNYLGAEVNVNEDKATFKNGNKKSETEVGMDENGAVAPGNKIKDNIELTVDSYGIIKRTNNNIQNEVPIGKGGLLLSVSDENTYNLSNVSAVVLVLSSIEIHKLSSPDESWLSVNQSGYEFNLLDLKNISSVLSLVEIENTLYNQIRFTISDAYIIKNGNKTQLTLPSSKLKFVGNYLVEQNKTTWIDFDFDPARSLIQSGDKTILKPTVKVKVLKEVEFEVNTNKTIKAKSYKMSEEKDFSF